MIKLWKFKWYSSYSFIGGLFKATDEEVENLIGKTVSLGEADGKYSEVYGTVERDDIQLVSDNPVVVEAIPNFGYNPLEYLYEEDEEDEEEE